MSAQVFARDGVRVPMGGNGYEDDLAYQKFDATASAPTLQGRPVAIQAFEASLTRCRGHAGRGTRSAAPLQQHQGAEAAAGATGVPTTAAFVPCASC